MQAWIKDRSGNVAVMFSLAVFMLLALGGGAFTMVRVNAAGARLQDAADGAALAAAVEAQSLGASEADIRDAADRWAASALSNAAHFDGPAVTTIALAKTAQTEVTVSMTQAVDTLFAGAVGVERITLKRHATAVAGPRRNACLILLEPSAPAALQLHGNPKLLGEDCVAHVNSAASGAIEVKGGASNATMQAVHVTGPAGGRQRGFAPQPVFGQPVMPDPLAKKIVWPAVQPCEPSATAPGKLFPGVYCEGLVIEAGTTLAPGLYVVQSGDVRVQGRGSHGDGVTIVLLDPAGTIEIKANNSLRLSAPKTGPWAGVAIAARPGSAVPTSTLHGVLELDGTLYLPGQRLMLKGNARIGGAGSRAIIARRLEAGGTPDIELAGGYPSAALGAVRLSR